MHSNIRHVTCSSAEAKGVHMSLGKVADRRAFVESIEVDAVADRKWFQQHPQVMERHRPISPREMRATGLPSTAMVKVVRHLSGAQFRAFIRAAAREHMTGQDVSCPQ